MTQDAIDKHPRTLATAALDADHSVPERMIELTGQPIGTAFLVRYVLGVLGLWVIIMTPGSVTLAIRIGTLDPAHKAASLSLIAGIGAAGALFANPILGRLSDRSTSRFGQRRPFIIGGVLGALVGIFMIGFAPSLLGVGIGWLIVQVAFNGALAATVSVLPERVPSKQRGRVSAFLGSGTQVGVVVGTFLVQFTGTTGAGMFIAPAVLGAVLVAIFVVGLKEAPRSREEVGRFRLVDIPGALWINPIKYRDFALAFGGRFLVWIALSLLTTYKTYFLIDHLGIAVARLPQLLFISLLVLAAGCFLSSVVAGFLSDLVHRRKIFVVVASVGFAVAMVVIASATTYEQFIVGVAIAGLAQGSYMGVDYALVSEVLPNSRTDAAKGMGVFNLSSTIPQTVAPILAPALLLIAAAPGSENYSSLYLAAAVFALAGAVVVTFIRKVR